MSHRREFGESHRDRKMFSEKTKKAFKSLFSFKFFNRQKDEKYKYTQFMEPQRGNKKHFMENIKEMPFFRTFWNKSSKAPISALKKDESNNHRMFKVKQHARNFALQEREKRRHNTIVPLSLSVVGAVLGLWVVRGSWKRRNWE